MNSKTKSSKGITLIALVITVIVLLILAGTAISIAVNGNNIFAKANTAVNAYNDKARREETSILDTYDILNEYIDGIKQVNDNAPGTLEVDANNSNIYIINSIEDLVAFANIVNSNENLYSEKTVTLGQSLDFQNDKSYKNPNTLYEKDEYGYKEATTGGTALKTLLTDTNGTGFEPIGNNKSDGFSGTFDGKNNAIYNLYENSSGYGGLFGYCKNAVTIKNIGIKPCNITASAPSGGIIGSSYGATTITITNCYNTGDISSSAPAGGIIGIGSGTTTITNCYNTGDIESPYMVGGIIGNGNGTTTITNSYNTGNITSSSQAAGGIFGVGSGTITNSYNTGNITSLNAPAGGIIGDGSTTITNCYNTGDISSSAPAGGIFGSGSGTITNSYNTGNITSSNGLAGGIVGSESGTIINCYNTGAITAKNEAGGIVGSESGTIINCYNTGDVTSSQAAGGIFGSGSGTITNCYNTGNITSSSLAGGIVGSGGANTTATNCYNTGNITTTSSVPVGGIMGYVSGSTTQTITNCHNTGNISGQDLNLCGEIIGAGACDATCTYLSKDNNVQANGATPKSQSEMDAKMAMSSFIGQMNTYVTTNNADTTKPHLKSWTLNNNLPVFINE